MSGGADTQRQGRFQPGRPPGHPLAQPAHGRQAGSSRPVPGSESPVCPSLARRLPTRARVGEGKPP
jgi:hypothetical protein